MAVVKGETNMGRASVFDALLLAEREAAARIAQARARGDAEIALAREQADAAIAKAHTALQAELALIDGAHEQSLARMNDAITGESVRTVAAYRAISDDEVVQLASVVFAELWGTSRATSS